MNDVTLIQIAECRHYTVKVVHIEDSSDGTLHNIISRSGLEIFVYINRILINLAIESYVKPSYILIIFGIHMKGRGLKAAVMLGYVLEFLCPNLTWYLLRTTILCQTRSPDWPASAWPLKMLLVGGGAKSGGGRLWIYHVCETVTLMSTSVAKRILIIKCTKFSPLILRKIIKILVTRCHILRLKCTKFDFGWGSAPDPAGGAYSTPQTPYSWI